MYNVIQLDFLMGTYRNWSLIYYQGDQKVSVHLTIIVQSSGAQRFFYHAVYYSETFI